MFKKYPTLTAFCIITLGGGSGALCMHLVGNENYWSALLVFVGALFTTFIIIEETKQP